MWLVVVTDAVTSGVQLLDCVCDGHLHCHDLLGASTSNSLDFVLEKYLICAMC